MAFISFNPGTVIKSTDMNANFVLAVGTDVSKTITVTHTWTASQTFTGGFSTGAAASILGGSGGAANIAGDLYDHVLVTVGFDASGVNNRNTLSNPHQVGVYSAVQANANANVPGAAGGFVAGFETALGVNAVATTVPRIVSYSIGSIGVIGAGSSVTRTIGVMSNDETIGTAGNAFIAPFASSLTFTGNWFIFYDGTRASSLGGSLTAAGLAVSTGNDLTLPGGGFGIANASSRFLSVAAGVNPALTFGSGTVTFGGAVTASGTITAPLFVGSVSGNLTGTVLTASQTNITAVGTLGSLGVTGTVTAGAFSGPLTGNVTGNLTGTVLTSSQTNITAVGTLTSLTTSGAITMSSATPQIIPTGGNFVFRDNANANDNLKIWDAGDVTVRRQLQTAASTATVAGFMMPAGTAPSIPSDGNMWFDGTNVKFRVGGVTKTFTLT